MNGNTEIQIWLINSIFILGILVFLLGLWIVLFPAHFLKAGQSLSKWVSTDQYFDYLDKPRYQEKFIYKHHQISGSLIVLAALYTLVKLIGIDMGIVYIKLPEVINPFWSEWFYSTLYYILLGANMVAVFIGLVMFVRPSKLKNMERVMNTWVSTKERMKKLDDTREIALEILPGNPRLFGLAVTLGGLYMVLSTAVMLL